MKLERYLTSPHGTFGRLFDDEGTFVCYVAELPWKSNLPGLSCIPAGRYKVAYVALSASGKYSDIYVLLGVARRSGILIHKGNYAGDIELGFRSDTYGCLLPGTAITHFAGQKVVGGSAAGLARLHSVAKRQSFELEVIWKLLPF